LILDRIICACTLEIRVQTFADSALAERQFAEHVKVCEAYRLALRSGGVACQRIYRSETKAIPPAESRPMTFDPHVVIIDWRKYTNENPAMPWARDMDAHGVVGNIEISDDAGRRTIINARTMLGAGVYEEFDPDGRPFILMVNVPAFDHYNSYVTFRWRSEALRDLAASRLLGRPSGLVKLASETGKTLAEVDPGIISSAD
jgi:hypothetical protein